MPDLPTGTVTFLFTDIEGSTRLAAEHATAWPELLARHQQLIRGACAPAGGVEVSTEGDSLFVAFASAPAGVAAAIAAQRALDAERWEPASEIRVRMGLHSGEAEVRDTGGGPTYVGINVHRAARIAAAAHGGQVLISDATRALAAHDLPDGVAFRDLGEHRLRGLDRAERIYQVTASDLPSEFGPIAAVTPNNLPKRLTSFLGREAEIAAVSDLLSEARLLTLTGPGGTGKTRLSLEVASRMLDRFDGGVWFIELGAITEPELVASTIAQHLGLPDRGGRTPVERLLDHIADRRMLFVLDNFEQVLAAAASVSELLAGAPNLTILVTSRSVLHVYGEREFPVPPLRLPDPSHLPDTTSLSQYEAVALFIERAAAVRPDFRVTNENAPAVAEICVRLDGLPLAIELAAARIRILTPQAMLARLGDRLRLLASGARDLPERQQTLRGAIAWSYDMLGAAERALFACLATFVGGSSLDAAERICGRTVPGDVLDALTSLVDQSLVRQMEGVDGQPRFSMLETIREFAMEQLVAGGGLEEVRSLHGELFIALAQEAQTRVMSSEKRAWLDRLEQEHDNIRAAITWAIEVERTELALRGTAAMWRFWQMRGHLVEGLERTTAALRLPDARDHPEARADALNAAAGLAYWLGDQETARAWYEEEIAQRRELGDRRGLAEALYSQSFTYSITGGLARESAPTARDLINQAMGIFEQLGDRSGKARCLWALANVDWGSGFSDEAIASGNEAYRIFREIDDQFMVGWSAYTLGIAPLTKHSIDPDPAYLAEARPWLSESLRIFAEARDVSGYTLVLDSMAILADREGNRERAARISGAVAALERITGTGLNTPNRQVLGWEVGHLRDDPTLAAAWAEGARMTLADVVAYALEEAPHPAAASAP
jgi:predicted ATPase/class 3 adenylate cyclase